MSRNRRHQTAAMRFGPLLRALGLCALLGGAGLGYVWQKEQINSLGDRLKQCERRHEQLCRENDRLNKVLESLQTLDQIEIRIREHGLGLVPPTPDQIVRLFEGPPPQDAITEAGNERLYADQGFRWWAHQ